MHPCHKVEREYAVRVFGQINDAKIRQLTKGVQLEDGKANFKKLTFCGEEGKNQWFNVTLTESRNHEVRRPWESVGMQVSRLIRIRYGDIYLPRGLPREEWIKLCLDQINYLHQLVDLKGEATSKMSVEQDRRNIKANQICRAVKQHTQVSLIRVVNKREIGTSKGCNTFSSKVRDKIKGNIIA